MGSQDLCQIAFQVSPDPLAEGSLPFVPKEGPVRGVVSPHTGGTFPAPVCFLEALHILNGNSQVASGTCPFSIYNFSSVKACSSCSVRKTRHHWKHQVMFIPRRVRFAFNFKSIVQHTTVIWKSTIRASLKYKIHWSPRSLLFLKYLSASLDPAENPFLSAVPWCKDCSCGHCLIIQIWLKTQCCAEILIEKKWHAFWS